MLVLKGEGFVGGSQEAMAKCSPFKTLLATIALILAVALLPAAVLCVWSAYDTWANSVVKIHRGGVGVDREFRPLSPEERNRVYLPIAGAVVSALCGANLLTAARRCYLNCSRKVGFTQDSMYPRA